MMRRLKKRQIKVEMKFTYAADMTMPYLVCSNVFIFTTINVFMHAVTLNSFYLTHDFFRIAQFRSDPQNPSDFVSKITLFWWFCLRL